MGGTKSPLEDLIRPLTFATGDGVPLARIGGLDALVRRKLADWCASLPKKAAGHQQAAQWRGLLDGYEAMDMGGRRDCLRQLLAGVSEIVTPPVGASKGKAQGRPVATLASEPKVQPKRTKQAQAAANSARKKPTNGSGWRLDSAVTVLPGVGGRRATLLANLGIHRLEDLLLHLPSRYEDRSQAGSVAELQPGQPGTLHGTVVEAEVKTTSRKRIKVVEALIKDDSLLGGGLVVRWYNQPHRLRQLLPGSRYLFSGKVSYNRGGMGLVMENPEFEDIAASGAEAAVHGGRVVAVYPVTEGLSSSLLRTWVAAALKATPVADPIDAALRRRLSLPSRAEALAKVHRPDRVELAQDGVRRLAFEEFYLLQLGLALKASETKQRRAGLRFANRPGPLETALMNVLPFALTPAQDRVVKEIQADMQRPEPMQRLVQGDVGCGKTVVALLALLRAVDNGYQGALMAPTEILALQHHQKLTALLDGLPINLELLIGGVRGKAKGLARIQSGEAHLVVGTQALIQDAVGFRNLGLAVVDEQHRFGVRQRAKMADTTLAGGESPHTLIMTATPIPRSLAMTAYGDLDLSVIDALPPGRTPVATRLYFENRRDQAYEQVRHEVSVGNRAYVVHPLVEASETLELRAAEDAYDELSQGPLAGLSLGLLHGRMSGEEKARVMADFTSGAVQVLITTTVVEVGVDVPEATVMVIEHAERFGLSQLHQLRGRVGRGRHAGHCLLVASHAVSKDGRARLDAMIETTDGFRIAERDLEIRGPGELFGQRQSGVPELKVANLIRDAALLSAAREAARQTMVADTGLSSPDNRLLKATVTSRWQHRLKWGAVG